MYARWTIGGKNPGELTVCMEMVLPNEMVSNGGREGEDSSAELFTFRQQLPIGDLLKHFPSIIQLND
jgi:hypothetical protein